MSGPDKQDYEPTEAEKASASVALANYNRFKQMYEPQLLAMRDKAAKGDPSQILRARAGADTMQALTKPNYRATQMPSYASDLSKAYQGQMGVASTSGKKIQNTMGSNVLGVARKQEADATTGMSKLSRINTSEALNRAKNNQQVAQAKVDAGTQLARQYLCRVWKIAEQVVRFLHQKIKMGMTSSLLVIVGIISGANLWLMDMA